MASSVAHDFNSVLTTIALISSSLTRHKEPAVAEQARTIAEAVVVGSHLVEHLSTMGRAGTLGETTADVAACVETLRRLMEPLVRDRASLVVSVSTPAPRVSIPALQLIQILMNLCLNAADAMSEMGTIEIQVRASTPDEAAESMAVIEVKDDGSGISAEIERDIFNPYFTTKEQGTGLGLAIVRDIVAEHGGRVVLHTRPGAGSTFLVMLPLAR
jgi:signal transduction histidine kinase